MAIQITKGEFCQRCLKHTFGGRLGKAGTTTAIVTVVLAPIANYAIPPIWEGTMNILMWAIPLGVFVGTVIVGLILAPYRVYQDVSTQVNTLEDDLNNIRNAMPNIHTELEVSDKRFNLVVRNSGGKGGIFTASGRVIVGKPESGLYVMYWEGWGEKCQINGGGGVASIRVAEKAPYMVFRDMETTIYEGDLALFKWGTSGVQTFPVHTYTEKPTTVDGKEGIEIIGENKCVLEVTITSDPPLKEEFGLHTYALEIDYGKKDELSFTEVSILDKQGSQIE